MPHYHNLDDETFVKLIENDFELIKRRTDGRVQLQYHNTPDGTGQDRRWHVLHGGHTSTLLDNAEVAGFTLGAITAMDAKLDMQCGKDFMAGEQCILPKDHSGGHLGIGV